MKAFGKRPVAIIVTLVMIIAAISVFGGGDLRKIRNEALDAFENGDGSMLAPGVPYDLNKRIEHARNLAGFAEKYLPENDEALSSVEKACETLTKAKTPEDKYAANVKLGEACLTLNNKLYGNYKISAADSKYANPDYFTAQLNADNDRMADSVSYYNTKALIFNDLIKKFPTGIVALFGGVSKLTLFGE